MSTMSSVSVPSSGSPGDRATRAPDLGNPPEQELHSGARINLLLKSSYSSWVDCISRALEPHGLTHSAYVTLLALHNRPHWVANPSLLAGMVAETKTNTTRICDRLTRQGLIRRVNNTVDRRRVDLTLTEGGEALVATLVPQIESLLDEAYSTFTSEERSSLERNLERLSRVLIGMSPRPYLHGSRE